MKQVEGAQDRMNERSRQTLALLLTNAERDLRLARAEGDRAAVAKAQARLDTRRSALDISAAAHLLAYGARPWPREAVR